MLYSLSNLAARCIEVSQQTLEQQHFWPCCDHWEAKASKHQLRALLSSGDNMKVAPVDIAGLARLILSPECKSICILTGAGVSVASGIRKLNKMRCSWSCFKVSYLTESFHLFFLPFPSKLIFEVREECTILFVQSWSQPHQLSETWWRWIQQLW